MKRIIVASMLFLSVSLLSVGSVFAAPPAYIDPNTGGLLFQILAVVFTMLSGFVFFFSSRIKMAFSRFMRSYRERRGIEVSADTTQETPQEGDAS